MGPRHGTDDVTVINTLRLKIMYSFPDSGCRAELRYMASGQLVKDGRGMNKDRKNETG